jgi:arylsulfatase
MVVSWPKGIKARNEIRTQFSHVIDIAPTVLEASSLPEPTIVSGVRQIPIAGASLVYSFDNPTAPERRTTQYFEIAGNRAVYHEGWFARTIHKAPWEAKPRRTLQDNSAWELFDVRSDFSLANDLAAENPAKLSELQAIFLKEAVKYGALPLDDRFFERLDAASVGRPDLLAGRTTERTELELVRRKPVAFPPEPLRYPLVQMTRAALAREDEAGRRGAWLRALDHFGIGFNS